MSHQAIALFSLCVAVATAVGCQSVSNSVASVSGGMKSVGTSIASFTGKQKDSKPVTIGGVPADHFTNSPDYHPLVTKAPSANPFVRMWENTSNTLANAVDFKPRVDAPLDEVSLATEPLPIKGGLLAIAGQHAEDHGDLIGAETQYRKALEQDPRDINALSGLARVLSGQQRVVEAGQAYQNARSIHPSSAPLANDFGLFYAKQNRLDDALAALSEAVRLGPENARYRNNIATVYVDAGRMDEALKHLMAVHLPAGAHYNLGYMLHRRGQGDSAREQFQLALQNDPSLAHARTMLARLSRPVATPAHVPYTPASVADTRNAIVPVRHAAAASTTLQNPIPTNHPLAEAGGVRIATRPTNGQGSNCQGLSPRGQGLSPQDRASNSVQPPVVKFR